MAKIINKITNEKKYYTTHEVANLVGVTSTTIIKWIKDGKIFAYKTLGGHRRIGRSDIDKLMHEFVNGGKL